MVKRAQNSVPCRGIGVAGATSSPPAACAQQQLAWCRRGWLHRTGLCRLDASSVTWIAPCAPEHPQQEGAPQARPSRYYDLNYAAKQRPVFGLIFLLYCLLLYKRLQFQITGVIAS